MRRTLRMDVDDQPTLRIVSAPDSRETRREGAPGRRLLPGELLAGRYRVLDRVGCGGMGVVYRVLDERLGLCVALKVLRPELADDSRLIERFRRELLLARQVSHRNVVRIHDIGHDGNLLFLTMDFVGGRSLQSVLREEGRLEPGRAASIVRQLALALEAAHEAGIVHRDLKPANVLIEDSGRACIGDFGVARSLGASGFTRAGVVVGTVAYLSPEQASGDPADGRSDLYALGILLFEMLTGKLPFPGDSVSEALAQRHTGVTRDVQTLRPGVPPHLAAILRRLLARDPSHRFQSARELIDALDGMRRTALRSWPHRWTRGLAAALVLPVLLAAGWTLWPRDWPAPPAAAGPRHVVAVLPLLDETGRPDLAWVSAGLSDMLAASLGESPGLRVVSSGRTAQTVADLKLGYGPPGPGDLRRLADLLGADRLITGRVRSPGGRLRVDLSLVASGLAALPSSALHTEGTSAEIFAVADSLGRALRERLKVEPSEIPVTSSSPAAARAYSQALGQLAHRDEPAAVPALERAVAADPGFTAAWIALARTRAGLGHRREALEAARRAVASLGPRSGRAAYEAQALEARLRGDPAKAREILSTLAGRYPYDVEARIELAEACGELRDLGAAIAVLRRVVEIDPNHPRAWLLLAKSSILAGDSRQAVDDYLVHALVVQNRLGSESGQAEVLDALGAAHDELGELDRAAESYEKAVEIRRRTGDQPGLAAALGHLARLRKDLTPEQRRSFEAAAK
ncbi:MAG TPA: protein kinase [Thermoanaerobaculia bacterium]|jgi:tetratricopeptide (TPR) repeat protein